MAATVETNAYAGNAFHNHHAQPQQQLHESRLHLDQAAPIASMVLSGATPATVSAAPPTVRPAGGAAATAAVATPPPATLYVGDLSPAVNEQVLFHVFSPMGAVASIRVCKNAVTLQSLGYAYVNFHNTADAEQAIEQLNFTEILDRPCRIMWSQRDPALRRSGVGNVFIKGLHPSIGHKELHDTFAQFGRILSCKVVTDARNVSKEYGFVHYETQEAANTAIQSVNGMLLMDKEVYVGRHIPRRARETRAEELKAKFTNVFVKELPDEVASDADLAKLFAPYGETANASLALHDESGATKGFGFVNFKSHDAAVKAVEALNGSELHGKKLYVARAQKKTERQEELRRQYEQAKVERLNKYQGTNLFIKYLEYTVDDDTLKQHFEPFGQIHSHKVMRDANNQSRGFGFVCYTNAEDAARALTEMNRKMISGKPIYVALAQRKEERKQNQKSLPPYPSLVAPQAMMLAPGIGGMYAPQMYFPGNMPVRGAPPNYFAPPPGAVHGRNKWSMAGPPPPQNGLIRGPNGYHMSPGPAYMGAPNHPAYARPIIQQQQPLPQQQQAPRRRNAATAQRASEEYDQADAHPPSANTRPAEQVLDPAVIATWPDNRQRDVLGSQLFAKVEERLMQGHGDPALTSRITGILLDYASADESGSRGSLKIPVVLELLENGHDLGEHMDQAIKLLSATAPGYDGSA